MKHITEYEPKVFWKHFYELTKLYRESGHEEQAIDYVESIAKAEGLRYVRYAERGNIIVYKPATPGKEDHDPVVVQGHLDMVCEKDSSSDHDFTKDQLDLIIKDGWISANKTTLGADDGFGVATMLTLLEDKNAEHPAIEALFTIEEETGMGGAASVNPEHLTGTVFLNVDSEQLGDLYTGCAGGLRFRADKKLETESIDAEEMVLFDFSIGSLDGGHSGVDIHTGSPNAVLELSSMLAEAYTHTPFQIVMINAGGKDNAIPREGTALIAVSADNAEALEDTLYAIAKKRVDEKLAAFHGEFELALVEAEGKMLAITEQETKKLLDMCGAVPNGVWKYSEVVEDTVETSSNFAQLILEKGELHASGSHRSFIEAERDAMFERVAEVFRAYGAEIISEAPYPGWAPDPNSTLPERISKIYQELFNEPLKIKALHAGLECGLLKAKMPRLDCVSFGPTIVNPHTHLERGDIDSAVGCYKLLMAILKEL